VAALSISTTNLLHQAVAQPNQLPNQPPAPAHNGFVQGIQQKTLELELERERAKREEAVLAIREKVIDLEAQRRRVAAHELEQLRRKRDTLEARIDYARRSVLQSFDVYDRGSFPTPSTLKRTRSGKVIEGSFERSKRLREQMLYRLLQLRRESGGLIANGDALNFFLELCGPSAFAHTFYRTAKPAGKAQADPDDAFLSQITDQFVLRPEVLRHIRYQRGLTGPKLSGRLNQDPLDVTWPAILKGSLSKKTGDIERRREEALKQLRENRTVSPEAADGLLDAVRDLLAGMHDEEESLMHEIRRNGRNSRAQRDWLRYNAAEAHVRVLLAGAYRLIEARGITDVILPPLDDKKGVTVEKLLTYMHENNLRFSPADLNGQPAYNSIFEVMSRYYIDLAQLKLQTAKDEHRVEALRQEEAQVKEVMLGNKLDNLQQTEIELARIKATAEIGRALIEARRNSESGGYFGETIPLRRVGRAYSALVVINENQKQEMLVDTGCTTMSMPYAMAIACGIDVNAGRDSLIHVADGSLVTAKIVVLNSVRVGRFTAHNVECTVFPRAALTAPPLLGMSFLGRFKVVLNGPEMVLSDRD
jgi:clan AA aspartic protease (TIGR02281 family)